MDDLDLLCNSRQLELSDTVAEVRAAKMIQINRIIPYLIIYSLQTVPAGILEVVQAEHPVMLQILEVAERQTQAVRNLEGLHNPLVMEADVLVILMVEQLRVVAEVQVDAVEVAERSGMPRSSGPAVRA